MGGPRKKMSDDSWIRIATYMVGLEAALAKSVLEDAGIECRIFNEHTNRILPHLSAIVGADVMIRTKDVEAAKELLKQLESPTLYAADDVFVNKPSPSPRRYFLPALIVLITLAFLIFLFGV